MANHLPIKWIVPFHVQAVTDVVSRAKRTIIVENNYSGQFFRYLRSETGLAIDGHIRKYDGEPFMPHHVVEGVLEQLASGSITGAITWYMTFIPLEANIVVVPQ